MSRFQSKRSFLYIERKQLLDEIIIDDVLITGLRKGKFGLLLSFLDGKPAGLMNLCHKLIGRNYIIKRLLFQRMISLFISNRLGVV